MAAGMTLMTRERRREPRAAERLPLAIRDASAELTTETNNLGDSGVYCTLDRFIAPMSKLELRFELPNKKGHRPIPLRCAGVVVRVEPVISSTAQQGRYHVAVLFTELAERDRAAIARFVRQRLSASSSAH